MRHDLAGVLALGQGLYYFVSGIWPLFSMRTFEMVTGPKADKWLVKTVGVLVSVIGAVLMLAGRRRRVEPGRVEPETVLLAAGSALGLGGIDTVYAAKGRISKIYLLDAVLEVVLVASWVAVAVDAARAASIRRAA